MNMIENEFDYTMTSLNDNDYDKVVTITFDEVPTLEHEPREGKESEYSKVKEDKNKNKLEDDNNDNNGNENITSTLQGTLTQETTMKRTEKETEKP